MNVFCFQSVTCYRIENFWYPRNASSSVDEEEEQTCPKGGSRPEGAIEQQGSQQSAFFSNTKRDFALSSAIKYQDGYQYFFNTKANQNTKNLSNLIVARKTTSPSCGQKRPEFERNCFDEIAGKRCAEGAYFFRSTVALARGSDT